MPVSSAWAVGTCSGAVFPPGLHIYGASRACSHFRGRRCQGKRKCDPGSSEGVEATARALGGPARLAATDDLVEIGLSRELTDKAVDPSEDDLASPQVAHSLDPQPQSLDLGQQRSRAQVNEMARQVEGKPAVPESTGLKAFRIRYGDHKRPTWDEEPRCMAQSRSRLTKVLERVPEDDRGPGSAHLRDLGVAKVRPGCVGLKTDGFAAMVHEGLNEGPISGSHIENRALWEYLVKTTGERCARPAKHGISEAIEPAGRGAVPAAVRLVQLRLAWPWGCRRHAAPGAPHPTGTTVVSIIEPVVAPRALAGSRRPGERPCQRAIDLLEGRVLLPPAQTHHLTTS